MSEVKRYRIVEDPNIGYVLATDYDALSAKLATAVEALWAIQEFTNGYDDVAGVTHRKAREALTRLEGPDPLNPVDSPQPPLT